MKPVFLLSAVASGLLIGGALVLTLSSPAAPSLDTPAAPVAGMVLAR